MSHNSLVNYYTMMFSLIQHHKYSITELEDMIPYERDIYVDMLMAYLKEEKERLEKGQ